MKIQRLDYEDHVFQFRDGDYVMSHVTQTELPIRVLRLETSDGCVGWGEIVRKPTLSLDVAVREAPLLKALVGTSVAELLARARQHRLEDDSLRGLSFGLETAYYDWIGRKTGLPLYALLGGKSAEQVPEYYSVGGGDASQMAPTLKARTLGWATVQMKLGVDGYEPDKRRVSDALASLSRHQILLADFNGALTVEQALRAIDDFDDPRLVWEEPCNTVAENTDVARRCGQPVMFDQCLIDLQTISAVVAEGVAHSICLKPALLGSLEVARAARDLCVADAMRMRIDGPWCGHIATAVCLHLAIGVPPELVVAGCDLRQPLILNDDWGGTQHLGDHHIAPTDEPGHGATPPV